ncbi:MAG TPA: type II 3-dehydroquinate dehydratase [Firmicutes bacterium]|nr:type II 3-dehydroquinate dehydratase [Bacillota bacterium]
MKILIINGPNLNMLGAREKEIYGEQTLADMNAEIAEFCAANGMETVFYQSNIEGELVGAVQSVISRFGADGIVLNAGAYTHYSHAIGDALACVKVPKVEVHISNVHARENFRHLSVLADNCNGVICGFGADSYKLACLAIKHILQRCAK